MKSKLKSLRISTDLWETLSRLSEQSGTSVSHLIVLCIKKTLPQLEDAVQKQYPK